MQSCGWNLQWLQHLQNKSHQWWHRTQCAATYTRPRDLLTYSVHSLSLFGISVWKKEYCQWQVTMSVVNWTVKKCSRSQSLESLHFVCTCTSDKWPSQSRWSNIWRKLSVKCKFWAQRDRIKRMKGQSVVRGWTTASHAYSAVVTNTTNCQQQWQSCTLQQTSTPLRQSYLSAFNLFVLAALHCC